MLLPLLLPFSYFIHSLSRAIVFESILIDAQYLFMHYLLVIVYNKSLEGVTRIVNAISTWRTELENRIKKKIINVNKITFNKHLPIYYSSTFSSKYNYLKAFNYPEAYCSSCFKFVCFSLAHVHGWVRVRELARLRLHTFRWYFNTQTAILLSGSIVVRNKQKQRDLCTHKPMHKHTMGPVLIFFFVCF